jgi:hypothetical protein
MKIIYYIKRFIFDIYYFILNIKYILRVSKKATILKNPGTKDRKYIYDKFILKSIFRKNMSTDIDRVLDIVNNHEYKMREE